MFSLFNCRSRQEYIELLLNDLCTYYSYGKFLMEKFVELFPLNEVKQQLKLKLFTKTNYNFIRIFF